MNNDTPQLLLTTQKINPLAVYAKVNGKIAKWLVDSQDVEQARSLVRDEVGLKHRGAVLVCVK